MNVGKKLYDQKKIVYKPPINHTTTSTSTVVKFDMKISLRTTSYELNGRHQESRGYFFTITKTVWTATMILTITTKLMKQQNKQQQQ